MDSSLPIFDMELEQAVLADVIALGQETYQQVKRLGITATSFYIERHQWIWQACEAIQGRIDLLTVQKALERAGQLEEIGGLEYLKTLMAISPRFQNYDAHAVEVRNLERRREYEAVGGQLVADAHNGRLTPLEVYQRHDQRLHKLSISQPTTITASTMFSDEFDDYAARARAAEAGQTQSLPLDLPELIGFFDNEFNVGTYTLLMGASGIGKTWLALQMALAISEAVPVLIWELEMVEDRIRQRIGAMHAQVSYSRVKKGTLREEEQDRYIRGLGELAGRPIELITGVRPMDAVRGAVIEMQDRYGQAGFLVVDTLNNLASNGRDQMYDNITRVSAGVLNIKVSTGAGVLGVIQQRPDFKPTTPLDTLYKNLRPSLDNVQNAKTLYQHVDWMAALYSSDHWAKYRDGYNDPECPPGSSRLYNLKAREQEEGVRTLFYWDKSVPIYRSKSDPKYVRPAPNGHRERVVYGQTEED